MKELINWINGLLAKWMDICMNKLIDEWILTELNGGE